MGTVKPPPFTLPAEPVDKYEVFWWRVDTYNDIPRIIESRAVYHVHETWEALCGKDERSPGAPFVNQWQLFHNGRFDARGPDWAGWAKHEQWSWDGAYATRAEAVAKARELAERRAADFHQRWLALCEWLANNS